jgi:hypothetical protein
MSAIFEMQDVCGFRAGDTNLQRYVKNNPTNATDPSGLEILVGVLAERPLEEKLTKEGIKFNFFPLPGTPSLLDLRMNDLATKQQISAKLQKQGYPREWADAVQEAALSNTIHKRISLINKGPEDVKLDDHQAVAIGEYREAIAPVRDALLAEGEKLIKQKDALTEKLKKGTAAEMALIRANLETLLARERTLRILRRQIASAEKMTAEALQSRRDKLNLEADIKRKEMDKFPADQDKKDLATLQQRRAFIVGQESILDRERGLLLDALKKELEKLGENQK